MTNRDDPDLACRISLEEKSACIRAVCDWFGESWMAGTEEHDVRTLFHRTDWVATAELISLGFALRRALPGASPDLVERLRRDIAGSVPGLRAGALFEILAASMFNGLGHPAALAPKNASGFDLTVSLPQNKSLRVSCKALCTSDEEIKFRKFASWIEAPLSGILRAGSRVVVSAFRTLEEIDNPYNPEPIVTAIEAASRRWNGSKPEGLFIPGWGIALNPNLPRMGTAAFYEGATSYQCIVARPHAKNEQTRAKAKLQKAFANMFTHCPVSSGVANVVFLKVPSSLRMEAASNFVEDMFDDKSSHVSAVYIYRSQVCSNDENTQGWIGHELREFKNPRATVPLSDVVPEGFHFELVFAIGRRQVTEPTIVMGGADGEEEIVLKATYAFSRGHHHYFTPLNEQGRNYVRWVQPPNADVTWWYEHKGVVDSRTRLGSDLSLLLI